MFYTLDLERRLCSSNYVPIDTLGDSTHPLMFEESSWYSVVYLKQNAELRILRHAKVLDQDRQPTVVSLLTSVRAYSTLEYNNTIIIVYALYGDEGGLVHWRRYYRVEGRIENGSVSIENGIQSPSVIQCINNDGGSEITCAIGGHDIYIFSLTITPLSLFLTPTHKPEHYHGYKNTHLTSLSLTPHMLITKGWRYVDTLHEDTYDYSGISLYWRGRDEWTRGYLSNDLLGMEIRNNWYSVIAEEGVIGVHSMGSASVQQYSVMDYTLSYANLTALIADKGLLKQIILKVRTAQGIQSIDLHRWLYGKDKDQSEDDEDNSRKPKPTKDANNSSSFLTIIIISTLTILTIIACALYYKLRLSGIGNRRAYASVRGGDDVEMDSVDRSAISIGQGGTKDDKLKQY